MRRPKGTGPGAHHHAVVNFRRTKVSRVALAAALLPVMGLLARPASAPVPLAAVHGAMPAALATAEPPRLIGLAPNALRARPTAGCASIRRELRFEMISDESQERHARRPAVCLAVYHPGG
jgi:hypothetical protein